MENPFKFGTVVNGKYFTDRKKEQMFLTQILNSPNHAILISPRRFGKSSLVAQTLGESHRESISINMQAITSMDNLAETILKRALAKHPLQKIGHYLANFRIVPTVSVNQISGQPEFSFHAGTDHQIMLEDAFSVLEQLGKKERIIVIFDEFQEILKINPSLDRILRSIMQEQQNINYILMGSQEDMMKNIFLRKKSPFYHFGTLIHLDRIPRSDFKNYLTERLDEICPRASAEELSDEILQFTTCHPYYTQQLAFQVWYQMQSGTAAKQAVSEAIEQIVIMHDFDYSRLWDAMNLTNKAVLIKLAMLQTDFEIASVNQPTSTVFSSLKRLIHSGIVIKDKHYELDDPFFCLWIQQHFL